MQRAWRCLVVLLLSCSPEYELLRGPSSGGAAGDGAAGGEEGFGGSVDTGGTDFGGTGVGGTAIGGTGFGGVDAGGSGAAGGSALGGTGFGAGGATCTSHLDCSAGTVCSSSQCVTCPEAPTSCAGPCDHGFEPLLGTYNGCTVCECAPVNACSSKADCALGQECYPGAQCEPGCSEPGCCRGNYCGAPGCAGSPIPHCLVAGCPGGAVCLAACDAVTCECDGTTWQCAQSPSTGGAPSATCPQACVSP